MTEIIADNAKFFTNQLSVKLASSPNFQCAIGVTGKVVGVPELYIVATFELWSLFQTATSSKFPLKSQVLKFIPPPIESKIKS